MADALDGGDLAAARERLPHLCGRDPSALDEPELARATVESVAENTSDAVVAPLFWGAVAGLPGLLGYRAVNTLDAMVGHRSPRYARFGTASARLDDAGQPGAVAADGGADRRRRAGRRRAARARRCGCGGATDDRHPSPNAGQCEAAVAGALGVRLGGRNVYFGRIEDRPFLGDGEPPAGDRRAATAVRSSAGGARRGAVGPRRRRRAGRGGRCGPGTRPVPAGTRAGGGERRSAGRRHHLRRRQERAHRRDLPLAAPARASRWRRSRPRTCPTTRRSRRDGRRRDRPGAGDAGVACGLEPERPVQPGAAQAGQRPAPARSCCSARPVGTVDAGNYRALQGRPARRRRCATLRRAARRVRRGDLRGRRQPGRDQPAGRRLRQHGPGPRRRPAGRSWSATSTGAGCSPRCSARSRCSTPTTRR